MIGILLGLIGLVLLGLSAWLFHNGLRKSAEERIMQRLGQAHEASATSPASSQRLGLERMLLRAGLEWRRDRFTLWLVCWALLCAFGGLLGGGWGASLMLILAPLALYAYIAWRYRRRVRQMIGQLPALLDHCVRSLKAGRTLNDAVLGAIDAASQPLNGAMQRVRRNVQLGMSLDDALKDLAELYDQDELRLFALGLKINHRFGGNASELMENLIRTLREREQSSRQLRAMTGETRITAWVLGLLPMVVAGAFLLGNPQYLLRMWNDADGQSMLIMAFAMQALGTLILWRMMRSI